MSAALPSSYWVKVRSDSAYHTAVRSIARTCEATIGMVDADFYAEIIKARPQPHRWPTKVVRRDTRLTCRLLVSDMMKKNSLSSFGSGNIPRKKSAGSRPLSAGRCSGHAPSLLAGNMHNVMLLSCAHINIFCARTLLRPACKARLRGRTASRSSIPQPCRPFRTS